MVRIMVVVVVLFVAVLSLRVGGGKDDGKINSLYIGIDLGMTYLCIAVWPTTKWMCVQTNRDIG